MPGTYSLELELFSTLSSTASDFEIWADGVLLGGYSNIVSSGGSTISIASVAYGGALPTSLEFRFNDTLGGVQQIEVRNVMINDRYVNTNNYLSGTTLNEGGSQTVNVSSNAYLFDASEPAPSEFTTGATQTFDGTNNTYRDYNGTTDQVFNMLGGRDVALLGSGNDKVAGDAGDDYIRGGAGNDLLSGGADNDRIYGGDDDDTIYGGTGNDRLHGDGGNDEIHGGAGNDRLQGNDGNDIITGGAGLDNLHGGDGDDYLFGDADADNLTGGNGADTLDGGAGNDLIYGGAGIDHINGGGDDDVIIGNQDADVIHGDAGNDTIYLMNNDFAAGEKIYGGVGTDELILAQAMTIDFTTGVIDGLETLTGSAADQDVTYTIEQALGFTTIDLGLGTDSTSVQISGNVNVAALGTPTVSNVENGFLVGTNSNDRLTISGAQLDSIIFGLGTIDLGSGVDRIDITSTSINLNALGSGINTNIQRVEEIGATGSTAGVIIDMSGQTDIPRLFGGNFDDTIIGGTATTTIRAGSGNDIITGGAGRDILFGDNDNDTFNLANNDFAAGESIDGGTGTDEIIFTNATTVDFTTGTLANLETLTGSAGNDDVTIDGLTLNQFTTIDFGGGVNDVLQITSTSTSLNALADGFLTGLETISASTAGAAVTIDISNQSDGFTVVGSSSNDTLTGGTGLDTLNGGVGDDIIYSSSVANSLTTILSSTSEANHIGGGWIVQTYTTVGTIAWTPHVDVSEVYYLVVGGGGGGGGRHGGGGGAGGLVTNWGGTALSVTATPYTITVGNGGTFTQTSPTNQSIGTNGDNSVFGAVTALGGGGGGSYTANNVDTGGSGGGGGGVGPTTGGSGDGRAENRAGGLGAQTDSGGGTGYGNDGGSGAGPGSTSANTGGGGGGGAGSAGSTGSGGNGGSGGDGLQSDITGTNIYYAGGGGGGGQSSGGTGGLGGGGDGSRNSPTAGTDGLGGGGGGARSATTSATGADGGSGTVILRYQVDTGGEFTTLAGGAGNDTLYGSAGLDIFEFSHVGAANLDTINSFLVGADQLDLSDLLTGYDSLTDSITDFIQITDSGADSDLRVDTTGSASFGAGTVVATIVGVTGLTDEAALVQDGTLLI